MTETYRMWRLVRYFRTKELDLIDWDLKASEIPIGSLDKGFSQHVAQSMQIFSQNRHPRAFKAYLCSRYSEHFLPKKSDGSKTVDYRKSLNDKNSETLIWMNACIDAGFLREDEIVKHLIYLPLKGRKFASLYGLIKEWVVEDVGILWATLGSAIIAIGAVRWDLIWAITGWVSPWW